MRAKYILVIGCSINAIDDACNGYWLDYMPRTQTCLASKVKPSDSELALNTCVVLWYSK